MTRRISKSGRAYTVGSHSGFSEGEPRVCAYGERCVSGGKIVLSRNEGGIWFYVNDLTGERWTVHMPCWRALGPWHGYPAAPVPVANSLQTP